MRLNRRSALALAALTGALLATTPAGSAAAAAAPRAVPLPIADAADVVSAGDRVFVSGGRNSTDVVVTAANGDVVGTVSNLPGPTDLLLSADRQTLYVALPAANAIAAVNTGTLTEFARFDTGAGACPSSLALTGRYLWFGYGCSGWDGNIGRLDLGRQPAALTTGLARDGYYGAPLLAAAAQNRGVLLVGQPGLSPASVEAYGIGAGGALTYLRNNAFMAIGSNLRDIALNPAGDTLYTASGAPYTVQAFPFADITTPSAQCPTGAYPAAVELSRDGGRVAGGARASYDPDVFVFGLDGVEQARFELGSDLAPGGLAWSPNGARLYAITTDWTGARPTTLHVLPVPAA
ncbi:YncE family protein [Micromonospora humi]|uniref:40-residue YVTN family beta-propeller repeat-containing protein n=1 Tax=Micromonospora humi TaxID=745366 RepID=A0A1C5HWN1_9ACTN|nr:hypothetical protein [Micromonospora humi]SCG50475.1 hypothetical protein GA0070213_104128 [Micromonospora humi]